MKSPAKPEDVIGEWGIRDVTPPSQRERDILAGDVDLKHLFRRPLRRRIRNFRAEPHLYFSALGGPLPYMRRLRRIEDETAEHLARLGAAYEEHRGNPTGWKQVAETWDFGAVNELIDRHNRWFPVESRLPMDPKTRDFVSVDGRSYRLKPLDAAWVLDRFPASEA